MSTSPPAGTDLPEMPAVADSSQADSHQTVAASQGRPQPDVLTAELSDEAEVLQASIKAGSVAQIVVAVIAVIALIYLLKLVLITTLVSVLLAFVLEPVVSGLARIRIPRAVGALFAVVLLIALAGGLLHSSMVGRSISPRSYPVIPGRFNPPSQPCGRKPARSKRARVR